MQYGSRTRLMRTIGIALVVAILATISCLPACVRRIEKLAKPHTAEKVYSDAQGQSIEPSDVLKPRTHSLTSDLSGTDLKVIERLRKSPESILVESEFEAEPGIYFLAPVRDR